jgi:choline dehydrogenase-like flavoprotein
MKVTDFVVRAAVAILPLPGDPQSREKLVWQMREQLPPSRWRGLLLIVVTLWGLAFVFRRGEVSRDASLARWVDEISRSRRPWLRSLGVWLKAIACLLVVSEPGVRRQIYGRVSLTLPSDVAPTNSAALRGRQPEPGRFGDVADYLVVGSGPAGATVARALAREGREVAIIEEGAPAAPAWAAANTCEALIARCRGLGMVTTAGPERMPVLQGRCVGGSSTLSSAIARRAPESVFAEWHEDAGLAGVLTLERIDDAYTAIEAAIHIESTAIDIFGQSNQLMADAAMAGGLAGAPTDRYTRGCVGLGRCLEGCPLGRKMSMNATFVPEAVAAGARLYTDCQVSQVEFDGTRAVGVRACWQDRVIRFRARKAVVLAASAVQTPILLTRSGIRHRQVGRRFQAHPGVCLVGIFDKPVRKTIGATQGYGIHHHAFKMEVLSLPDELLAARMQGTGTDLIESLEKLPYAAVWVARFRAAARGRVRGTSLVMPAIHYRFTPEDELTLGQALAKLGETLFAAGAREVWPNIAGLPARVHDADELRPLADGLHPARVTTIMSHMFGTAVMGSDPEWHVADARGRVHGVDGLIIADSALFPNNVGVNPQHTIMMLAQHVAWSLLDRQS